jgi:type II secretory pathway pseudopilin PulG
MRNRKYEAFTLVEMLIVMGILIILMVIGIAAGRFALNRANDVAHQNAADQLYQGLQAFYTDNRRFPVDLDCNGDYGSTCTPAVMMADPDVLGQYMDLGAFNGGTTATFIYSTGGDNKDQAVLVCASMRGDKEDSDARTDASYYCNGNGFGVDNMTGFTGTITQKTLEIGDDQFGFVANGDYTGRRSEWDNLPAGGMGWTELGEEGGVGE